MDGLELLATRILHTLWIAYKFKLCIPIHYCASYLYGLLTIFYQMWYYLSQRIDKCNQQFNSFSNRNFKKLNLMKIIREHNNICTDIVVYNKFWRFYLLLDSITLSIIIALMLFISLFSNAIIFIKAFFLLFCITFMITFYATYFIASIIPFKVRFLL